MNTIWNCAGRNEIPFGGEANDAFGTGENCRMRVGATGCSMPTNGFWANPDWLWCRDKKWRPIESGTTPLVDGFPKRMGYRRDPRAIRQRLKGYGNAIVIPQAVEFIKAIMNIIKD